MAHTFVSQPPDKFATMNKTPLHGERQIATALDNLDQAGFEYEIICSGEEVSCSSEAIAA